MFLENKKSGLYLGKKVQGKSFLVKIYDGLISEKILDDLTKKEIEFIKKSIGYQNFKGELYDSGILDEILYYSKLLFNIGELSDSKNNLKGCKVEEKLYQKSLDIHFCWFQFPKEFIYNSNHIEGSRIPKSEVENIINQKKYKYKVRNEIQEVKNSIQAWEFLQDSFIFNISHIKKIYHILTKGLLQETGDKYPRGFKKVSNIAGLNSQTTAPEMVEREMIYLIETYRFQRKDSFSLQLAFDFHLKYEQIHPFENGNGRTGRLIMNKILLQNAMIPMIVYTENKQSYSNSIASSNSGRKKKYYKFMLEQYKKTLDNEFKKCL